MAVSSLESPAYFFVTQTPVRANGVHMLALIDAGVGITAAGQSLLPLLVYFDSVPLKFRRLWAWPAFPFGL